MKKKNLFISIASLSLLFGGIISLHGENHINFEKTELDSNIVRLPKLALKSDNLSSKVNYNLILNESLGFMFSWDESLGNTINITYDEVNESIKGVINENGVYQAVFDKINPQCLTDTINVNIGDKNIDTSVVKYLGELSKSTEDESLKDLISDILLYGGEAQEFSNYKVDNLASNYIDEFGLTGYGNTFMEEYSPSQLSYQSDSEYNMTWVGAYVEFANTINVKVQFWVNKNSGIPQDHLSADINIGNETKNISGSEFKVIEDEQKYPNNDSVGTVYEISIDDIYASQYGETNSINLKNYSFPFGNMKYSVNTYFSNLTNDNDIYSAAANYGLSAFKYLNNNELQNIDYTLSEKGEQFEIYKDVGGGYRIDYQSLPFGDFDLTMTKEPYYQDRTWNDGVLKLTKEDISFDIALMQELKIGDKYLTPYSKEMNLEIENGTLSYDEAANKFTLNLNDGAVIDGIFAYNYDLDIVINGNVNINGYALNGYDSNVIIASNKDNNASTISGGGTLKLENGAFFSNGVTFDNVTYQSKNTNYLTGEMTIKNKSNVTINDFTGFGIVGDKPSRLIKVLDESSLNIKGQTSEDNSVGNILENAYVSFDKTATGRIENTKNNLVLLKDSEGGKVIVDDGYKNNKITFESNNSSQRLTYQSYYNALGAGHVYDNPSEREEIRGYYIYNKDGQITFYDFYFIIHGWNTQTWQSNSFNQGLADRYWDGWRVSIDNNEAWYTRDFWQGTLLNMVQA